MTEIPTYEERREEYLSLFCTGNLASLRSKGIEGILKRSSLRSLAWKVFLGCLPHTTEIQHPQWTQVISIHRKEYEALQIQYRVDPRSSELDPHINNPLSQSEESPWYTFFQNAELEKEIDQDIQRTYPEHEFFQRKSVREQMLRILFIYARQTPQLSYKQGMHELLAPIIYLLDRERIENDQPDDISPEMRETEEVSHDDDLKVLMDSRYIEHDAFTLFSHLMKLVKPWFQQDNKNYTSRRDLTFSGDDDDDKSSPIVDKCKYIQNVILKEKDPELYQQLQKLRIEPQLYMLRWVRLLLGREFHLEDVLALWDAMFAYSSQQVADLQLVDYICVAMLIFIRQQLIDQDYTHCLRRLFKYPPVEDVHLFIEEAIKLQQTKSPVFPPKQTPAPKPASRMNRASVRILDPLANAVKHMLEGEETNGNSQSPHLSPSVPTHQNHQSHHHNNQPQPVSQEQKLIKELRKEVDVLQQTQYHMANRLERIIYSLQSEFAESLSAQSESGGSDTVLIALAEMKQIRDILSGLLPIEQSGFNLKKDSEDMMSTLPVNTQPVDDRALDPLGVAVLDD